MGSITIFVIGAILLGGGLAIATRPKTDGTDKLTELLFPNESQQKKRCQATVRIIDKRIVTEDTSYTAAANYSRAAGHQNHYFMTFEAQDGSHTEMEIPEAVFCGNVAGFVGTLTYDTLISGERETRLSFVDFVRDRRYRVNGH